MTQWRFYGRKRDTKRLGRCLRRQSDRVSFHSCYYVIGRRRVGKTELLKHAVAEYGGDRPWVEVTIGEENNVVESAGMSLDRLIEAVRGNCPELLKGVDLEDLGRKPEYGYLEMLRHLLHNDVVVTIDEFQRCADNGIHGGGFQVLLDDLNSDISDPLLPGERWGTLIIMGSHQQKMLTILGNELLDRVDEAVDLKPWTIRTVFKVAAEHGLLARPGRFLALWTAFQGMPGRWKRFITGERGALVRDFLDNPDDDSWRRGFLERELAWVEVERNRFDNGAWIALSEELRPIMTLLGDREYMHGLSLGDIHATICKGMESGRFDMPDGKPPSRYQLLNDLQDLQNHLGLVRDRPDFMDPKGLARRRWLLHDGGALFQARVFPELFGRDRAGMAVSADEKHSPSHDDTDLENEGLEVLDRVEGRKGEMIVSLSQDLGLKGDPGDLETSPEMVPDSRETGVEAETRTETGEKADLDKALARLKDMEGTMLERMLCEVVRLCPELPVSLSGVRLWKGIRKDVEVDLVAVLDRNGRDPVLLLGECKRDPSAFRADHTLKNFDIMAEVSAGVPQWMRNSWEFPSRDDWPVASTGRHRRHLAVSPCFTMNGNWRHLVAKGFDCIGIRDMARELGIEPGPMLESGREADRAAQRSVRLNVLRKAKRLAGDGKPDYGPVAGLTGPFLATHDNNAELRCLLDRLETRLALAGRKSAGDVTSSATSLPSGDDPLVARLKALRHPAGPEARPGNAASLPWMDLDLDGEEAEAQVLEILRSLEWDVRILGEEYRDTDFTGREETLERCYFNKRPHQFSTSELRERVVDRSELKAVG